MMPAFVAMKRIVAARTADVDLEHVERGAVDAEVLDEPEHRIVLRTPLGRAEGQQRLVVAVGSAALHRERREGDGGNVK